MSLSRGLTAAILLVAVVAPAATPTASTVVVRWVAPAVNVDGSPLTDLAAYIVYRGVTASQLTMVNVLGPNDHSFTDSVTPGAYYWAVTAMNKSGLESDRSAVVTKIVSTGGLAGNVAVSGAVPVSTPASTGTDPASEPTDPVSASNSDFDASRDHRYSRNSLCMPKGTVWCSR